MEVVVGKTLVGQLADDGGRGGDESFAMEAGGVDGSGGLPLPGSAAGKAAASISIVLPQFRNVVIIMTTNAGAKFGQAWHRFLPAPKQWVMRWGRFNKLFSPEFRNRLDAIVSFASLDENIIQQVVDKFLLQLEQQLLAKNVEIEFTDGLKAYLAEKGFDPLMGARPMSRLIQTTIRKALADELLFGKLAEGGRVTVDWDSKTNDVQLIFPTTKSDRELEQAVH